MEDSANLYFSDKDTEGMLAKVAELHAHWRAQLRDSGFSADGDEEGSASSSEPQAGGLSGGGGGSSSGRRRGEATVRAVSFIHSFGRDLREAEEWVAVYRQTLDPAAINCAWDLYSGVYRRIKKQVCA